MSDKSVTVTCSPGRKLPEGSNVTVLVPPPEMVPEILPLNIPVTLKVEAFTVSPSTASLNVTTMSFPGSTYCSFCPGLADTTYGGSKFSYQAIRPWLSEAEITSRSPSPSISAAKTEFAPLVVSDIICFLNCSSPSFSYQANTWS